MKRILTIAGSDSGGGAGIQADLKTITLLGGYGMSALTALTAQNTVGVQAIHEIPAPFVEKQIDSVLRILVRTRLRRGCSPTKRLSGSWRRRSNSMMSGPLWFDPVMVAKSGDYLLRREAQDGLIKKLIPLATVVTPNLLEASALTGLKIGSLAEMRKAAFRIHKMGAKHVVVKGGHLEGAAVDLLYDGTQYHEVKGPRMESRNTHGTGCTFASALATLLARGEPVYEAVKKAKIFITLAIQSGLGLAKA